MKSAIALLIKALAIFCAAWISFSLFANVFLTLVLLITGFVAVINYFVGDLLILPRFGNISASIADGIMAAVTAYIILILSNYNTAATSSIWIFTLIVTAFEFFYHMYLVKAHIVKRNGSSGGYNGRKINYGTETAKEIHPYGDIWKPSNRSDDHDL